MTTPTDTSREAPCRDRTNIVDSGGECFRCDAISGEACRDKSYDPTDKFKAELQDLAERVEFICPHCGNDKRDRDALEKELKWRKKRIFRP